MEIYKIIKEAYKRGFEDGEQYVWDKEAGSSPFPEKDEEIEKGIDSLKKKYE